MLGRGFSVGDPRDSVSVACAGTETLGESAASRIRRAVIGYRGAAAIDVVEVVSELNPNFRPGILEVRTQPLADADSI